MTSACSRSVTPHPPGRSRTSGSTISPGRWDRSQNLVDARQKLAAAGALVGQSDHRVSKSLYARDPNGIEFEVMWRVPAEDWDEEKSKGSMIAPLDLDAAMARWGDRITGAAAGSAT